MAGEAKILSFFRGSRAGAASAITLAGVVSAVVPAFNEERTITAVLELLRRYPGLLQITVVDDGSTDGTSKRVLESARQDLRVRLLRLDRNRGKGAALAAGAEASPSDLVLFLDADLIGVEPWHLDQLIEPVRSGSCHMSLAVLSSSGRASDFAQSLIPGLSGQRCLRWSLFRETPGLEGARYGAETALNRFARRQGLEVRQVRWQGVSHRMKCEKHGLIRGILSYLRMYWEVLQVSCRTAPRLRHREPLLN